MNSKIIHIEQYFSNRAHNYRKIYEGSGRCHQMMAKLRWRSLYIYYRQTFCPSFDYSGKRVLDIGCGVGYHAAEVVRRNGSVLALDISGTMITQAQEYAKRSGTDKGIRFVQADFGEWSYCPTEKPFDIIFAHGVFDYVAHPQKWIQKMSDISPAVIATFPTPGPLMPIIKFRYNMVDVYNRFYKKHEIINMFKTAGFGNVRIVRTHMNGVWVHAQKEAEMATVGATA